MVELGFRVRVYSIEGAYTLRNVGGSSCEQRFRILGFGVLRFRVEGLGSQCCLTLLACASALLSGRVLLSQWRRRAFETYTSGLEAHVISCAHRDTPQVHQPQQHCGNSHQQQPSKDMESLSG